MSTTAEDALSTVRVERKPWGLIPQSKTLGKVFSLTKSKVETTSEHENEDAREDDVTTDLNRMRHAFTSSTKDEYEREKSSDDQSAVRDAQSVSTEIITSPCGRFLRSTRRQRMRSAPLSSRAPSCRSFGTASSGFSGIRDDLSTAYSASTWKTSRYSSDGDYDNDDHDTGLPFSAFDSAIVDALRGLMGTDDDNSYVSYSDSSSDSETDCDSTNDTIGCESKSVATYASEESLDRIIVVPKVSVLVDKEMSTNIDTKISSHDEQYTGKVQTLERTDTASSSKMCRSVGGEGSWHLGSTSQEISGSIQRNQSDVAKIGATGASEESVVIKAPVKRGEETDIGGMKSNSFESTTQPLLSAPALSTRDIINPSLSTNDRVEVSLLEVQTVRHETLDSDCASSQQISNHVLGHALPAFVCNSGKNACTTSNPKDDNMGRYSWLRGLGGPLSRKAGDRKSRAISTVPSQTAKSYDEGQNPMVDQPLLNEETEETNNGDEGEGVEIDQYPMYLDEDGDKSSTKVGDEESPLALITQNTSKTTLCFSPREQDTGPKNKSKPGLFSRFELLGRKKAEGPGRRSESTKLDPDTIPIIPTGSTHEAQDLATTNRDSGLSLDELANTRNSVEHQSPRKEASLTTPGSRDVEEVALDQANFSKVKSAPVDSSSLKPKESDDSQALIADGKFRLMDTVADEKMESGAVELKSRHDKDGEARVESTTSMSSQVEIRESPDTCTATKNDIDDVADNNSSHPETCLSSMFCCLFWESKQEPSIYCAHCQKAIKTGEESVKDDIGDPQWVVNGEFHKHCREEREKVKEKWKKVIRQIRLFGHLKRKHLRRQRALHKARAVEEAKKAKNENLYGQETKHVGEVGPKPNDFRSRLLRGASNRDGSPPKTRDGGWARHAIATHVRQEERVDVPKTRPSLSPTRRREQERPAGLLKTRRSLSPVRRARGDVDTTKPLLRRLREGNNVSQRGELSPKRMGRKMAQGSLSPKRTRSLSRGPSSIRRQPSLSMRKVRFSGIPNMSSRSRSRSRSRSGSPQRMERRHSVKRNKNVLASSGSLLKRTMNSPRNSGRDDDDDDDDGDDINLEEYKVVKIKGMVPRR